MQLDFHSINGRLIESAYRVSTRCNNQLPNGSMTPTYATKSTAICIIVSNTNQGHYSALDVQLGLTE